MTGSTRHTIKPSIRLVTRWEMTAITIELPIRLVRVDWDPRLPLVVPARESQEQPFWRGEAREPAPASGAAVRMCKFSIPGHRSGKISDGELHDAGTWSWLLDQLYGELDGGLIDIVCLPAAGGGREFRVTLSAGAVGRLHNILQEACERFHRKRIRVVFLDRFAAMEVRHP
jgi:hypothetical protein